MTTIQLNTANSIDSDGTIRVQLDREPIQRYTQRLIDNYIPEVFTAMMPEEDSAMGLDGFECVVCAVLATRHHLQKVSAPLEVEYCDKWLGIVTAEHADAAQTLIPDMFRSAMRLIGDAIPVIKGQQSQAALDPQRPA